MKNKYDIAICYRIYPKISKIPPIYPDDKFMLSELCLASLVKSLEGINAKWFVILDNCPDDYLKMFKKYLNDDAEYIETSVKSNGKTFGMQMDILLNQNYSDKIYFAEDDYFYLPNKFKELLKAIENPEFNFISPYDHLDLYNSEFHNRPYYIKFYENTHWRSCGSTTMTFLTTKALLKSAENVFRTYIRNNYDSSLWMTLTRDNVTNIFRFFKLFKLGMHAIKIFVKAWIYSPFHILFGKKYTLYTPIPSFAQHLDNKCMAPGIDWDEKFEEGKQWLIK